MAENMLTRVEFCGHTTLVLDSILHFKKDGAAYQEKDKCVYENNGRRMLRNSA